MNVFTKQSSKKYQGNNIFILVDLDEQQVKTNFLSRHILGYDTFIIEVAYGEQELFQSNISLSV
jgi:hypothetical protein